MKKEHYQLLSSVDFRTRKRITRVLKAIEMIERNSTDLVLGMQTILHLAYQNPSANAAVSAKDKRKQFRETWLDKQEVMQLMPISERSLYSLRKQGDLPSYTFKGKIFFKLADVEALMKGRPDKTGIAI